MSNKQLGYYQLIGIMVNLIIISIWAFGEGRMMPFYALFASLLFLPFAIVSVVSILNPAKYKNTIQIGVFVATLLVLLPSYSLPFFMNGEVY